jgi:Xaa-Pro aminopeptidase
MDQEIRAALDRIRTATTKLELTQLEKACLLAAEGIQAAYEPLYEGEPKPTLACVAAIIYRHMREQKEL